MCRRSWEVGDARRRPEWTGGVVKVWSLDLIGEGMLRLASRSSRLLSSTPTQTATQHMPPFLHQAAKKDDMAMHKHYKNRPYDDGTRVEDDGMCSEPVAPDKPLYKHPEVDDDRMCG